MQPLFLVLTLLLPSLTWAETPVLTPEVGPQLEAAFARAEPNFRLQDAKIHPHQADAQVCRPAGTCVDLRLTRVEPTCAGVKTPMWCVEFPQGMPADAAILLQALGGDLPQDSAPMPFWQILLHFSLVLLATALLHLALRRHPRVRPLLWLWLPPLGLLWALWPRLQHFAHNEVSTWGLTTTHWLLVFFLLPLFVGAQVGLTIRCIRGLLQPRWLGWLLLLALPLLGAVLAVQSRRLGALDGLAMALLLTLALLATAHARWHRPLPWIFSLLSLCLGLIALEFVCRFALPPPPVIESAPLPLLGHSSPRPDGLPVGSGELLVDCALHAELGEETARCLRLDPPPKQQPWTLDLGDSMLFGSGVQPEQALPAQLQQLHPGVPHLNAGVPGTSVDIQLLLLQRILAVSHPAHIVLYVMPGNDVDEMGQPAEACLNSSPLVLENGEPRLKCPQAMWAPRPPHQILLHSRLPLPIAALTEISFLARYLEVLHRTAMEPPRAHEIFAPQDARRYEDVLLALVRLVQKSQIPLQIVLMPLRRSVYLQHTEPRRAQVLKVLRALQLPFIDTQPQVDLWVQQDSHGESGIFANQPPGDIHLNPTGLHKLAEFLAPQLGLPSPSTPTL